MSASVRDEAPRHRRRKALQKTFARKDGSSRSRNYCPCSWRRTPEHEKLARSNGKRHGRSRKHAFGQASRDEKHPGALARSNWTINVESPLATPSALSTFFPLTRAVQTGIKHDPHQHDSGDDRTNHAVTNFRARRSHRNGHGRPGGQENNEGQGQRPEK